MRGKGRIGRLERGEIEGIALRYSGRGMERLTPFLPKEYCRKAAERIWTVRRGTVLLATGFYVAGCAETDGPPGTLALARALQRMGFFPVVVTDRFCANFFEPEGIAVEYVPLDTREEDLNALWERRRPELLISVERCGRNGNGDYTNMRGVSIARETARLDPLFEEAARRRIPTVGIGDGGNEIGMGNLSGEIAKRLSIVPCVTRVEYLILATVSNWGAYALTACLQLLTGETLLPTFSETERFLSRIVACGSVDGVTKRREATVDGFPPEREKEILCALSAICSAAVRRKRTVCISGGGVLN